MNRRLDSKHRKEADRLLKDLKTVPRLISKVLRDFEHDKSRNSIKRIARKYAKKYKKEETKHFLYLGRNINFPTALEGALKLKEICYISSEGYAAGEMKHGPIALAYRDCPVVCVTPKSVIYEKMFSNIREIKSRHADIIAVASSGDRKIKEFADHVICIPDISEFLSPMLAVIPLQLLAYHISVLLGYDPDKPRNLAKSVTVE
jgi:glucosamine--fructose-6-phosphate aminotransferase (isomerizing)